MGTRVVQKSSPQLESKRTFHRLMAGLEAVVSMSDTRRSRLEVPTRAVEEGEAAVGKMSHLPPVGWLRRALAVGSVEA